MKINPTNVLLSRNFKKFEYHEEFNEVVFYDGEVRPGEAVFKKASLVTNRPEIVMSHGGRYTNPTLRLKPEYVREVLLSREWARNNPVIEIITPVDIIEPGGMDIVRYMPGEKTG